MAGLCDGLSSARVVYEEIILYGNETSDEKRPKHSDDVTPWRTSDCIILLVFLISQTFVGLI